MKPFRLFLFSPWQVMHRSFFNLWRRLPNALESCPFWPCCRRLWLGLGLWLGHPVIVVDVVVDRWRLWLGLGLWLGHPVIIVDVVVDRWLVVEVPEVLLGRIFKIEIIIQPPPLLRTEGCRVL